MRERVAGKWVLRGEERVLRLKGTLQRWRVPLLTARGDEKYCAERARIGRVHGRVGLPRRYGE